MRILIVEDEALTAMSMQLTLEDHGYEIVATADDCASAVAQAKMHRPELAFVDIQLSGGDSGLDVAQDLVAMGISVIFATGNCPGDRAASLAIGCLHKPISDEQLLRGVAIAKSVMERKPPPPPPSGMHVFYEER